MVLVDEAKCGEVGQTVKLVYVLDDSLGSLVV
jgi:hypothetical protein